MGELVQPQNFYSDSSVPPRIIGTEVEYNVHMRGNESWSPQHLLQEPYLTEAELHPFYAPDSNSVWLGNGGHIRQDVGHLEYCTPEALGPLKASAADMAGILAVYQLCEAYRNASTANHPRAYRSAGTTIHTTAKTSGIHDNFLVPIDIDMPRGLLETYLATRSWAWSGEVGEHGFRLSQKNKGIGAGLVIGGTGGGEGHSRTEPGKKPMAWLKTDTSNDDDVLKSKEGWGRLEIRFAESGSCRETRTLQLATTSLMLRMIEHRDKLPEGALSKLTLRDPLIAARQVSADLSMSHTLDMANGKKYTAIDVQEGFAELAQALDQTIKLPDDESQAIPRWLDMCERMKKADLISGETSSIDLYTDFAQKLQYVHRHVSNPDEIRAANDEAVFRSIVWDRIFPAGPGALFWRRTYEQSAAPDPIGDDRINKYLSQPPKGTRAEIRANAVRNPATRDLIRAITWSALHFPDNTNISMAPHQTNTQGTGTR